QWVGQKEVLNALLLTLTGGLTLAPTCLVIWHYLTSTVWKPLCPAPVSYTNSEPTTLASLSLKPSYT
ncbi:hypothetical protein, partial [Enterobacter hormaechei]